MISRVISFGGSSIRIDASGVDAVRMLDFLFGAFLPQDGADPHITFRLEASDDGNLSCVCGDEAPISSRSWADLASLVLERATYHLADKSQHGLVLHAAAVAWRDQCLLLPGSSGAGKTTLTAWLVTKGFTYLTDELVYIPLGTREVHPFPRPLNVKVTGKSGMGGLIDFEALGSRIVEGTRVTLVPGALLDGSPATRTGTLAAVLFPRFQAGQKRRVEPMSKAEAGMALMACLVNARNLPTHGLPDVTRLTRAVPACRLTYGSFDQIDAWVARLMDSDLTDWREDPPKKV